MSTRDVTYVARVPLFTRLADLDPETASEAQPLRSQTRVQLLASLRAELATLLNSRCPLTMTELLAAERSVVNYGLCDLSAFLPGDQGEQQRLEQLIEKTIHAFEPRLRAVKVRIAEFLPANGTLVCGLEGRLVTESLNEAVSFPVFLKNAGRGAHGRSSAR